MGRQWSFFSYAWAGLSSSTSAAQRQTHFFSARKTHSSSSNRTATPTPTTSYLKRKNTLIISYLKRKNTHARSRATQNGINWADLVKAPYSHSSPTLSADTARLLLGALQGGRSIVRVDSTPALPSTAYAVAVSGAADDDPAAFTLAIVNDGAVGFTAALDATAWAPADIDADVIVTQASATARAEVVAVVRLPSAGASGGAGSAATPSRTVVQSFPAYSTTVLRVPSAARTRVDAPASFDTYVQAGTSSKLTFGASPTLLVSTSKTTAQSSTNLALIAVSPPAGAGAATTKAAVLSLTTAAPTLSAYTGQLQALCISTARWAGNEASWTSLVSRGTLRLPSTSSAIDTVGENFVVWPAATTAADPPSTILAGGLALPPSTPAGTKVRLDVGECVRAFNGAPFGVALYRPFRNAATSNTAPIAADDLAGGTVYSFHSLEASDAAVRPTLSVWLSSSSSPP